QKLHRALHELLSPRSFGPRCPTIRCEKCNKLGHMAQLCQILRPWECVPFMCGFQSPGQGFFYIPDMCAAKQSVEKTNNVVITIVEG
uniref:CCHC-type domain-containing protein n=1 Tax=Aegilops tauschii subsp. strangulata TaxID=200361 RepID=A0A452ZNQ0_AEGTS